MTFPKSLRLQLGLSQAQFADLLGTNAGQLSMVESGLRDLPAPSLEIANAIQKTLSGMKAPAANDNKLSKKNIAHLNKEIRSGQVKLEALKTREQKLTEKLNAARCLLAIPQKVITLSTSVNSEDVNLHLALLQRKAAKKAEQYELNQIKLQILIESVEAIIIREQVLLNN